MTCTLKILQMGRCRELQLACKTRGKEHYIHITGAVMGNLLKKAAHIRALFLQTLSGLYRRPNRVAQLPNGRIAMKELTKMKCNSIRGK
jgi:hypothetical protein